MKKQIVKKESNPKDFKAELWIDGKWVTIYKSKKK